MITPETALTALTDSARPLSEIVAPRAPGVYAWFLVGTTQIGHLRVRPQDPLYIGKTSDLEERTFATHFATGSTGFSTLRRSVGAILKEELELTAIPRAPGPSKTNTTNYRFTAPSENRLTAWMVAHLHVGVASTPTPEALEPALIALAGPLLNLTGWPNPTRAEIKVLRKACADQARLSRD